MNIQASGLSALLSGGDALDKLHGTLLEDGAVTEQFAGLLQQQLATLQQSVEKHTMAFSMDDAGQNIQQLAALLGNNLPQQDVAVDSDLEQALTTLQDIVSELTAAGLGEGSILASPTAGSVIVGTAPEITVTDEPGQEAHSGVDAASPSVLLLQAGHTALPEQLKNGMEQETIVPLLASTSASKPLKTIGSIADSIDEAIGGLIARSSEDEDTRSALEKFSRDDILAAQTKKPADFLDKSGSASHAAIMDGYAQPEHHSPSVLSNFAAMERAYSQEAKAELVPMSRHFAHPEWGKEFTEKIVWMHRQAVPAAELNLNPRHLGPVSIHIDVNQDQASVSFVAQHAVVKEAIEAALPRLREMFQNQQLDLVDVNVSQQQSEQHQAQEFDHAGNSERQSGDSAASGDQDALEPANILREEIESGRAMASQGILSLFA